MWKEHGYQEKAIGDITRIYATNNEFGPQSATDFWGFAIKYAAVVRSVFGVKSLKGKTPMFAATGQRPNLTLLLHLSIRMSLRV